LSIVKNLDPNSPVFQGTNLDQKFTSKLTFEKRFVWVDITRRTIHMSQFFDKERRHKEATLSEVTSLTAGPPAKLKEMNDGERSDFSGRCLTINFKKGGGVDFMFATEQERNIWYDTLRKIVIYINAVENPLQ
jgi:hypothetical protein